MDDRDYKEYPDQEARELLSKHGSFGPHNQTSRALYTIVRRGERLAAAQAEIARLTAGPFSNLNARPGPPGSAPGVPHLVRAVHYLYARYCQVSAQAAGYAWPYAEYDPNKIALDHEAGALYAALGLLVAVLPADERAPLIEKLHLADDPWVTGAEA